MRRQPHRKTVQHHEKYVHVAPRILFRSRGECHRCKQREEDLHLAQSRHRVVAAVLVRIKVHVGAKAHKADHQAIDKLRIGARWLEEDGHAGHGELPNAFKDLWQMMQALSKEWDERGRLLLTSNHHMRSS